MVVVDGSVAVAVMPIAVMAVAVMAVAPMGGAMMARDPVLALDRRARSLVLGVELHML
jgi:hypothetical protein